MRRQVDITRFLDERPVGSFQIRVAGLCALVLALDGFDTQAMSFVAPSLSKAWQLRAGALGPVFGAALFGIMIGSLAFGALADYFGRKRLIIAGLLVFALGSLATVAASDIPTMIALRFLTGIGLGGVLPNAIALTSEYGSQRRRTIMIMVMFAASAVGSSLGGFLTAQLIATHGWTIVFWAGGILPILLVPALILWLPESISWLALRPSRAPRVRDLLQRIDPTAHFEEDVRFSIDEERGSGFLVSQLFAQGRAGVTVLVWALFFMNLFDIFLLSNWLPTLAHGVGFDVKSAIVVGIAFQLGGIIGTIGIGLMIERRGFHQVLLVTYAAGCAALMALSWAGASLVVWVPAVFVAGAGVIGGQIGANAYTAKLYPTAIRGTGLGWALGIGRIGSIIGALIGGAMLASQWTSPALFQTTALPQFCSAFIILALILLSRGVGNTFRRVASAPKAESTPKEVY